MVEEGSWPIRQALTRPVLIMGTERPLLLINLLIGVVGLMTSRFSWMGWLVLLFCLAMHGLCVQISKHDPRAMAVYQRSGRYQQGYYPPIQGMACRRQIRPVNSFPKQARGQS